MKIPVSRRYLILCGVVVMCCCVFAHQLITYRYTGSPEQQLPAVSVNLEDTSALGQDYSRNLNTAASEVVDRFSIEPRLPSALIIGAPKCGTRGLIEIMSLHPQMVCSLREMHFFSDKNGRYGKGLQWYREHFPPSRWDQITMEKTPSYYTAVLAPLRVYLMNPKTRLILLLREPVERLISHYSMRSRGGKTIGMSFVDWVIAANGSVRVDDHLVANSLYDVHTRRWLEYFPLESLLIIDSRELVKDPLSVARQVEKHLDLPPHFQPHHFYFNATKGFYCWHTPDGVAPCLKPSKGTQHVPVDQQFQSRLRKFFAPHNRKLYSLIGRNFDWPEV